MTRGKTVKPKMEDGRSKSVILDLRSSIFGLLCMAVVLGAATTARAYTAWNIGSMVNSEISIGFGTRTYLYGTVPGRETALQLHPNPYSPPAAGTQVEITLYRTENLLHPGAPREFFNLMTATGFQYDSLQQNDHQIRFSSENHNGGHNLPFFFCGETPVIGEAADCVMRVYVGDSNIRGIWICRAEDDCRNLFDVLWP